MGRYFQFFFPKALFRFTFFKIAIFNFLKALSRPIIIQIVNSPYNFSIQNFLQNSDRVQLQFQSPEKCTIKHLKHTKLYSIELLSIEMTSDPSNYHREYSTYSSNSVFQFEGSDVISVLKNSVEYSFVFFKYLFKN